MHGGEFQCRRLLLLLKKSENTGEQGFQLKL